MATRTPNNNLRKPAGTDYVLIGDLNENMDILDSVLGNPAHAQTTAKENFVAMINEARLSGGANAPYIGENLNWWVWDVATVQFIDTGIRAPGEDAGFDAPTASAETVSPTTAAHVEIIASGPNTSKTFDFRFKIPQGISGEDGREIEMQKTNTHIQLRYVGDADWTNLIPLADITGPDGRGLSILDFFNTLNDLLAAVPSPSDGDAYGVGQYPPFDIYIWGATTGWVNNGQLRGADGSNGREIALRVTSTYIQWQYVGDSDWTNLIALVDLKGADGSNGADGSDGINGRDGKSAFASAQAGGYTGTEARFNTDLAALDGLGAALAAL